MTEIYDDSRLNLPAMVTPEWFVGFTDGEGCFHIFRRSSGPHLPIFKIKLRWDDQPILERINRDLLGGLATINTHTNVNSRNGKNKHRTNSQDSVQLQCSSRPALAKVRDIFDKYPLMSKKARDFQVWRAALNAYNQITRGPTQPSVSDMRKRDEVLDNFDRLLKAVRKNLVQDSDLPRLIEEAGVGDWDKQLDLIA